MARFRITAEQIDLCDGSDIRVTHFRDGHVSASWQIFSQDRTGIVARVDLATDAGWRERTRLMADDYPCMLALVRFASACGAPREDVDTHDASECPRVFGAVCAHPDCARRDREIAAFKREMGAL